MSQASLVQEHMDVISSDRKTVGKVDHLDGPDKIKLTKQSSPTGEHHHFILVSWIDHVDQHVHLNKTGADVTAHWEHEGRVQTYRSSVRRARAFFNSYRTAQACLGRQKRRRPS